MVAASAAPPATVGILALQGDVREHALALGQVGVASRPVRRPEDLDGLAGLVLPGGESTTLSLLLGSSGLFDELAAALAGGLPTLATCAGLVLLASELVDGRSDQRSFGALACTVRRNGYGRQRSSFEAELAVPKVSAELGVEDRPLPAVFIRAPQVVTVGEGVEVLATVAGAEGQPATPALVRQGPLLAAAFHPELTSDRRLHQLFAQMIVR